MGGRLPVVPVQVLAVDMPDDSIHACAVVAGQSFKPGVMLSVDLDHKKSAPEFLRRRELRRMNERLRISHSPSGERCQGK
jgi:hypothetical protein